MSRRRRTIEDSISTSANDKRFHARGLLQYEKLRESEIRVLVFNPRELSEELCGSLLTLDLADGVPLILVTMHSATSGAKNPRFIHYV